MYSDKAWSPLKTWKPFYFGNLNPTPNSQPPTCIRDLSNLCLHSWTSPNNIKKCLFFWLPSQTWLGMRLLSTRLSTFCKYGSSSHEGMEETLYCSCSAEWHSCHDQCALIVRKGRKHPYGFWSSPSQRGSIYHGRKWAAELLEWHRLSPSSCGIHTALPMRCRSGLTMNIYCVLSELT